MIEDNYFTLDMIGRGGSSNVYKVWDRQRKRYAAKIMREDTKISGILLLKMLYKEMIAMEILSLHPNILKWFEVYDEAVVKFKNNSECVKLAILEYAENGSLFKYIEETGPFDENVASFIFFQLLNAVKYMHEWGIAHWDIKPQNILLDEYFNVKLSDFGTCEIIMRKDGWSITRKGTRSFMAPEVLPLESVEPYDPKKADIFSLGVTLHSIVTGEFSLSQDYSDKYSTLNSINIIKNSQLNCQNFIITEDASSVWHLISMMLSTDPLDRPSIEEIEQHPWLQTNQSSITPGDVYLYFISKKQTISS